MNEKELKEYSQSMVKELTYINAPLYMPNGGQYFVQIVHIDGPKIQLDTFKLEEKENE